jgi:hypothetical protein
VSGSERETVHFVVPDGIDDPARVSGGNVVDRHVRDGLAARGWSVRMSPVDVGSPAGVREALAHVPDDGLVLIDGLIAGRAPEAMEADAERLRIVVLAHMVSASFPDADPRDVDGEERALAAARCVITTSTWTRRELRDRALVASGRIVVAQPGSEEAEPAIGTPHGGALLCVGVVAPHKGQDTLIEALANLGLRGEWTCTIAGSLSADPAFARRLARRADEAGIGDRIDLAGVLDGRELDRAYRRADLLVAPSRIESYGMAIADALRRGIPVVASSVGGIPQTVAPSRAAVLVEPGEPGELSDALRRWMVDPGLRARLTEEARSARSLLPRWSGTVDRIAQTLVSIR